jgi:hypothetical protein
MISATPRALELEIVARALAWRGLAHGPAKEGALLALVEVLDEYERQLRIAATRVARARAG